MEFWTTETEVFYRSEIKGDGEHDSGTRLGGRIE